ncbi:MAG: hypothetical protein IT280_06640 [Ignavibacteria bacterium]|nr:hypothetical protein [Ignavibacteria bacterium]
MIFSCNDSGVSTSQNSGTLSLTNLKMLDKNVDGTYELWGSVETSLDHDENSFRSMGRFAVNPSGQITDTSGGTFSVNLSKISNINNIGDVLITIQPPGYFDTIPSNIKILGGAKQISGNDLIYNLTMTYNEILPISSQFSSSAAKYILATPTKGIASSEYKKGLWFTTDTTGTAAGITLPVLPDTAEWIYQAWVKENNTANIYNIGRFESPNTADDNQQCQMTGGLTWNLPGNDWLLANCPGGGLPDIADLENNYNVFITLEPKFEQGAAISKPFYLVIFSGIINHASFGTVQTLSNGFNNVVPSGQLKLSVN